MLRRRRSLLLESKSLVGPAAMVFIFLIAGTLGLSGCSGDPAGISSDTDTGTVVIGLTDSQGDLASYTVDVLSLTLTKASGAVVETLPMTTTVDFAQYAEMTEFLTAATIPTGVYTEATLELDYRNADIQVENANGDAVKVETIKDENGDAITTLELSVHLEGVNALLISPGIPAHLTLDFNLNASNRVEFDANGPNLTVQPALFAELEPESPKIHRLRGPLKEVDTADGTFTVIIRPFIHVLSGGDQRFGTLEVITDKDTIYDINGQPYQGAEGLAKLAEQQSLTATVVMGDLNTGLRQFEASQVYAGSSVPGGALDVVTGNVISRQLDQITVKGATLIRAQGSVVFNDTMTIQLGAGTVVSRQLSKGVYDSDDISVGQRIMAFGKLNGDETTLDATDGHAHMLLTTLRGTVVDSDSAFLVNLTAIDGRSVSLFDFTGTGDVPGNDADPTNYEIGALDPPSLAAGTPVKVRGFVTAFGHTQDVEDFEAQTLIDVSDVKGVMVVTWFPASTGAIENLATDGFTLNLTGVGLFHHLNRSGVVTDLTELLNGPWIEPRDGGQGLFCIGQDGSTQAFFTFEGFFGELSEQLAEGGSVGNLAAIGSFDDASSTMTAELITVKLQ